MNTKMLTGLAVLTVAFAGAAQAAEVKAPKSSRLQVVSGAKALSITEKASVDGRNGCYVPPPPCACPEPPKGKKDGKPGYGFGTTGHYGPPGQGFSPDNTWRQHVRSDGQTPSGRPLPPRAFTTPTR